MILHAADVTVARGDGEALLRGVDLDAGRGEIIAVLGPSGSGKTSLALTLAGAREPLAGTIRLPSRTRVGILSAFPERHFVAFTVDEEVGADWPDGDVGGALSTVGLPRDEAFRSRSPWSLSLGEQRRLAIASNLIRPRDLLVWDEPTASLDPLERDRLAGIVGTVIAAGAAIVLTGHDLRWAAGVGARFVGISGDGLRELDLSRSEDRRILAAMGYELPRLWTFFSDRIPRFWSSGAWRRPAGELARLAISSSH